MSRVYQNPPARTARRTSPQNPPPPPPTSITRGARAPVRPTLHPTSTTRGVRAPIRGRTMHTQPLQQKRNDDNEDDSVDNRTNQPERTVHVGFVD